LEKSSAATESTIKSLESNQSTLTRRLEVLETSGIPSTRSSSSAGAAGSTHTTKIPIGKRTIICVGGFRYSESEEITTFLNNAFKDEPGFKRSFSVGGYSTRGKVEFIDDKAMWAFLILMKGKKMSSLLAADDRPRDPNDASKGLLWHNVDKYPDELALSRKSLYAKSLLVDAFKAKFPDWDDVLLGKALDANRDAGSVVLVRRLLPSGALPTPIKLYRRIPGDTLGDEPGAQAYLDSIGVVFNLADSLAMVNDPPRQ
jgi:hypothetical protein